MNLADLNKFFSPFQTQRKMKLKAFCAIFNNVKCIY